MILNFINIFFKEKFNQFAFFIFLSLLIFLFSHHYGMFWDNVLFASKMGNHLFNTGLFNWYIPDSYDPGHPPILGFLLAIFWKVFGHELWVSHLLMIPFTVGLFYQIFRFVSFYTKPYFITFLGFLLIIIDPTLSTQLVIVNPEVIQLFLFFLAINSILYQKKYLKIITLFFLSIITFRSMMLFAGVFIFDILNKLIINKQKLKSNLNIKFISTYAIASIPAVIYISWRLIEKGWIQTHPNSPWEEYWHFVSVKEFIKNIAILGHRYVDFGRIFVYIFILFSFLKFKKQLLTKEIKQLFLLAFSSVFFISIISLLAKNPMGHRYFIASYMVLILLSFIILLKFYKKKKLIYICLFLGLASGNLWIYPRDISQGWDASLAHIPYYNLREKAIVYLDQNNIPIENVASFFPNSITLDNVDLSGNLRFFSKFDGQNEYLFYSNVYNLTDDEYEQIDNNYKIIKQFSKNNIYIYIYKNNTP